MRQGGSALTLTLPARWVKQVGLKPGDDVEVLEESGSLRVSVEPIEKRIRAVSLNIDGLNNLTLNRHLDEFYRLGAQEVSLIFSKGTVSDYQLGKEVLVDEYLAQKIDRFIGMEVFSQTKNKIVIQSLLHGEDVEKIDAVQSRIYFLMKEVLQEFLDSLDGDFKAFDRALPSRRDNILKFINYYLRLLNVSGMPEEQKSRLFSLFTLVGLTLDKVRHTSHRVSEMKVISPKVKSWLATIFGYYLEQFDVVFKENFSLKELVALIKKRYDLVREVNKERFSSDELKVVLECNLLLNTINEFTTCYAAMHIEQYVNGIHGSLSP